MNYCGRHQGYTELLKVFFLKVQRNPSTDSFVKTIARNFTTRASFQRFRSNPKAAPRWVDSNHSLEGDDLTVELEDAEDRPRSRRNAFFENTDAYLKRSIVQSSKTALIERKRERVRQREALLFNRAEGRTVRYVKQSEPASERTVRQERTVGDIVGFREAQRSTRNFMDTDRSNGNNNAELLSATRDERNRDVFQSDYQNKTSTKPYGYDAFTHGVKKSEQLHHKGDHCSESSAAEPFIYQNIHPPNSAYHASHSTISFKRRGNLLPHQRRLAPEENNVEKRNIARDSIQILMSEVIPEFKHAKNAQAILDLIERQSAWEVRPEVTVAALTKIVHCRDWPLLFDTPSANHLLDRAFQQLTLMNTSLSVQLLIALSRLKTLPRWFHQLILRCDRMVPQMAPQELSGCLNALKRFPLTTSSEVLQFRTHLLNAATQRLNQFTSSSDLCSLGLALAGLRVFPEALVTGFVHHCSSRLENFSLDDLASVAWTIARLPEASKLYQSALQAVQRSTQKHLSSATSGDVLVSLCWSIGVTQSAIDDFLPLHLSSALRPFIPSLATPHLVTIPWAFARNQVIDDALMTDILFHLSQKLEEINANQMSTLLWTFSKLGLSHPTFFDALAERLMLIVPTFQPSHIARAFSGLSQVAIRQDKPYQALWEEAIYHLDAVQPWDILTILKSLTSSRDNGGFVETGDVSALELMHPSLRYINAPIVSFPPHVVANATRCVERIEQYCEKLSAAQCCDFLEVLHTFSRLNDCLRIALSVLQNAARTTCGRLFPNSAKRWEIPASQSPKLIASLLTLLPTEANYFEECFSHLRITLDGLDADGVFRFLHRLGWHQGGCSFAAHLFQMHLHRRPNVLALLLRKIAASQLAASDSMQRTALCVNASLGLHDPATKKCFEAMLHRCNTPHPRQSSRLSIPFIDFSRLMFAFAQIPQSVWDTQQAQALLREFLKIRYAVVSGCTAGFDKAIEGSALSSDETGFEKHYNLHHCKLEPPLCSVEGIGDDVETLKTNLFGALVNQLRCPTDRPDVNTTTPGSTTINPQRVQLLQACVSSILGDSFLRLAWACLRGPAQLRFNYVIPLMEDALKCYEFIAEAGLPEDVLRAQQVCVFLASHYRMDPTAEELPGYSPKKRTRNTEQQQNCAVSSASSTPLTLKLSNFVIDCLHYKREDPRLIVRKSGLMHQASSEVDTRNSRFRFSDFPYAEALSHVLTVDMKLRHKMYASTAQIYTTPICFPHKPHTIDVLDFPDVTIPAAAPTGTALVRHQQLLEAGYTVTLLHLNTIYQHIQKNTLVQYLAEQMLPQFPECQRFLEFQSSNSSGEPDAPDATSS